MSDKKMLAHKGARVRVTFEGVLRSNLPEGWDNLTLDTGRGNGYVYAEYGSSEDVQIEVLSDLFVPGRIYRDQGGREGFALLNSEDDLIIHWLAGGAAEVSELAKDQLPLVQVYPPVS